MAPTVELLEHNRKLYASIADYIDKGEKSIFYSEATGLGKSYVFMKLVSEYFVNKRVLYIVPKIAIWENMVHYREFVGLPAQIIMSTFAAFNTYAKEEELYNKYDLVFVDECHHMLSDIQGKNVAEFLRDMITHGKFTIGCTATPKYGNKYVDKEFFNVSCYGYDVFEAIDLGLLPKVDIAVANTDVDSIPEDVRVRYSVSSTKSVLEQIIEERSDITHWLAYFGRRKDLEDSEKDIRKLFPEFTVVKLYYGAGDPKEVIELFEKYDGKIILLSVSMMLEGMHLDTVGGVLLYRNVTRTHTYFQIYGRLCKINSSASPLLVDMTGSVFNIDDFAMFKSDRAETIKRNYKKRDLFDVESKSYRYVQLSDELNPIKVKEYKDIVWTTNGSLAAALGKRKCTVTNYLRNHPDKNACDYIDYVLGDVSYTDYVNNGYSRYGSVVICGVTYKFKSVPELIKSVGREVSPTGFDLPRYVRMVEWENQHGFVIGGTYRGIDITSINTLVKSVGVSHNTLRVIMDREGFSAPDCVDVFLNFDEYYMGVCLLHGIDEAQKRSGIDRVEILKKYSELGSMKELLQYYSSDSNCCLGIDMRTATCSKVAYRLGIDKSFIYKYMYDNKCGLRECIDFFYCTEDERKVIDTNHGAINLKRVLQIMIPGKDDLWYSAHSYVLEPIRSTQVLTEEELEKITKCVSKGCSWNNITDIINNMECNRWAGKHKSLQKIKKAYDKQYAKKETSEDSDRNNKNAYHRMTQEEISKIVACRDKGYTWGQVAVAVNSLRSNTERGIKRSSSTVLQAYYRYYKNKDK